MLGRSPEDSMQNIDKRSMIWECLCLLHWKHLNSRERITQSICIPSKNTGTNLSLKQMFEISEQLILEQSDEIFGVSQISWESSPWKQLSLVNDEEVISGLLFGLVGRDQRPAGRTWVTWSDDTG